MCYLQHVVFAMGNTFILTCKYKRLNLTCKNKGLIRIDVQLPWFPVSSSSQFPVSDFKYPSNRTRCHIPGPGSTRYVLLFSLPVQDRLH